VERLLNEIILSFLEHRVLPHCSHNISSTAGPIIFFNYNQTSPFIKGGKHFDWILLSLFDGTWPGMIPGLRSGVIAGRIRAFFNRHSEDAPVSFDDECLKGLARVAAYLFTEAMDAAERKTLDSQSSLMETPGTEDVYILPTYVRTAIYCDEPLLDQCQYSTVFWSGTESA